MLVAWFVVLFSPLEWWSTLRKVTLEAVCQLRRPGNFEVRFVNWHFQYFCILSVCSVPDAIPSADQIRITTSLKSQRGSVWTKNKSIFEYWEVEVTFRVTGRGRIGADGLVLRIWLNWQKNRRALKTESWLTTLAFRNRRSGSQRSKAWKDPCLGQPMNGMGLEFSLIPLTMMERLVGSKLC